MKYAAAAAFLLFTTSAFANPFDAFIGTYVVSEAPVIRVVKAAQCTRASFADITVLAIKAENGDSDATHEISIVTAKGHTSNGIYAHFVSKNLLEPEVGTYSTLSGTSISASVETGSLGMKENSRIIQTISVNGTGYSFVIVEELLGKSGRVEAGCYYQVQLEKL
ncbi:MAG: hypothetical protein V4692_00720 [Bdellovibrionota bacterium]